MNRRNISRAFSVLPLLIGASLILSSCGGGSGGGGTTAGSNGSISGTAVKGPVSGAAVTAYAIDNGTMGAQVGTGTTDSQGNFMVSTGTYSGPLMFQMSGGTYTDEATNAGMAMHSGDMMTAVIPSVVSGSTMTGIQITPLTSMAQARAHTMTGGMTDANITAANAAVGAYFMVDDILRTLPINPLLQGSGIAAGVNQSMKNYGMTIAALSQYAKTLGMPTSSGIVTAMMNDASDGMFDGMMGGSPISLSGMGGMMSGTMMQSTAGTSSLATAMTAFMNDASVNLSGLTAADMQALINQLNTSSGNLTGAAGSPVNGMISGTVAMGPVSSGTMKAYAVTNGTMGAQLASGSTDSKGNFTMSVGSYAGTVMLQMSGGTYTDLATGATMTLAAGDVMTGIIPSLASGSTTSGLQITPLTSMAQMRAAHMTGGMTETNAAASNTAIGSYFLVNDILKTRPLDPSVAGSGTAATADMRNYGMTIAAISQEAGALGMSSSSGMVTAFMQDASDGVFDGTMNGSPIAMGNMGGGGMMMGNMQGTAGTSGLATAMTTFLNNASMNKSGLTSVDMNALLTKLNGSNGTIQ